MAEAAMTDPSYYHSDAQVKPYSCLNCRLRKIKCDRRDPCSNCTKSEKRCSFIPPVRGKRKITKSRKEGLHAKVRRYEELLKSYGAKVEPTEHDQEDDDEYSDVEMSVKADVETTEDNKLETRDLDKTSAPEESRPKFVMREGSSRYFESALWHSLGDESHHPEERSSTGSDEESDFDDSNAFILSPGVENTPAEDRSRHKDLAALHPSIQGLTTLWEAFIERVDPIVKILHRPTLKPLLIDVVNDPYKASKSSVALAFNVYLAAISSMSDEECQSLFDVPKSVVFSRYTIAARQALTQAGFLSTTNIMVLGAYSIYLIAVRPCYRSDVLYILSGNAVRIALRMGLHRDGTSLKLSPFETEIRRRLWWWIVQVDLRVAEVVGMMPSTDLFSGDTKPPLNLEDEDLTPNMVDWPPERSGITPAVLTKLRCDLIDLLRTSFPDDPRMDAFASSEIAVEKKEAIIAQFEDHMEKKYLRYCDPTDSLHSLTSIFVRSMICRMRLLAHNPRRSANPGIALSQHQRDIIFTNATKLLDYINLMQESSVFAKFRWIMGTTYLWYTILCVLVEARHRKTGPEVDRLWRVIGSVYSNYPAMFEEGADAIFVTMGRWTLEVWDQYVAANDIEGNPIPSTPEFIDRIRRVRKSGRKSSRVRTGSTAQSELQTPEQSLFHIPEYEDFASTDFSELLSFDINTNEWGRFM